MRRRRPNLSQLSRSRAVDLEPALGWRSALPRRIALGVIGGLCRREARTPDEICSRDAAGEAYGWSACAPAMVKGYSEPVETFAPTRVRRGAAVR